MQIIAYYKKFTCNWRNAKELPWLYKYVISYYVYLIWESKVKTLRMHTKIIHECLVCSPTLNPEDLNKLYSLNMQTMLKIDVLSLFCDIIIQYIFHKWSYLLFITKTINYYIIFLLLFFELLFVSYYIQVYKFLIKINKK